MESNPIAPTIPFDKDGKHHGFLNLPYSRNDSAWGAVMTPVCVIRNGNGPTVLLTGANHGDEYEGPIALQNLALNLKPRDIKGRVIIVPMFNYPAFRAGWRNSPIDDGNMNRVFPGNPKGSVTEKIADYFSRTLVPEADFVLDIHSGGKTLEFLPLACAHVLEDKRQQAASVAAMQAFNAPYSLILLEISNVGMYDTEVEKQGKVFVTTELGGGGTTTSRTVSIARKGIRNFLIHCGVLQAEPVVQSTVNLDMPGEDCFVVCEHDGLLEPEVDLGDELSEGDVIARVWPLDRTGERPIEYRARLSGMVAGRHFPGLVQAGDCMSVIAVVRK
ncbi:MAG: N(2)-acetyl-L-2,4-diaminobutanoate deacetylase DoeB [Acidiferrobacterales bacterium]|nr:N(2)-acetyl-L-2,4-diaminobutanoate deacetylase DoeB [Acidiferrobacterales bacterium]